jgi:hypothetical protein
MRKEKSTRDGALKIAEDTKEVTIVDCGGSRHELTQNMDMIGDVRMGDNKVDGAPYQVMESGNMRKERSSTEKEKVEGRG